MGFLSKFNQLFGFTQTESRVVLFLIITFLFGLGIKLYQSETRDQEVFDYSFTDSVFEARSQFISSSQPTIAEQNDSIGRVEKQASSRKKNAKKELALLSININTGTKDELMKLPGVGEATAERIIIYRDEHGPFKSIDELMKIKGIGKKKLENLAPYCTIGK
ncbi:MAG TPA: helix-hairpin-helix domain-containing protein [Bacteroidota bacterium]|nr:helix-hairpin-helix domain-containing protein [Bacteroidota bacterium]